MNRDSLLSVNSQSGQRSKPNFDLCRSLNINNQPFSNLECVPNECSQKLLSNSNIGSLEGVTGVTVNFQCNQGYYVSTDESQSLSSGSARRNESGFFDDIGCLPKTADLSILQTLILNQQKTIFFHLRV